MLPAGGNPDEPTKEFRGTLIGYFYSDDHAGLFDGRSSDLGFAATLELKHRFGDTLALEFGAVGYTNALNQGVATGIGPYFEGTHSGAFINVANLQLDLADTTLTLGRQLIDTPLFSGIRWLLAPGAFEALSVRNTSVEHLELYGAYIGAWRPNNSGDTWIDLDKTSGGRNWLLGGRYDDGRRRSGLWFDHVDYFDPSLTPTNRGPYRQLYGDIGYSFDHLQLSVQSAYTDYRPGDSDDSRLIGARITAEIGAFQLSGSFDHIGGAPVGFIGMDTLYTSSWNTFASMSLGNNFQATLGRDFGALSATLAAAWYAYGQFDDPGHEFDIILAYKTPWNLTLDLVFSTTDYSGLGGEVDALEIFAKYRF